MTGTKLKVTVLYDLWEEEPAEEQEEAPPPRKRKGQKKRKKKPGLLAGLALSLAGLCVLAWLALAHGKTTDLQAASLKVKNPEMPASGLARGVPEDSGTPT